MCFSDRLAAWFGLAWYTKYKNQAGEARGEESLSLSVLFDSFYTCKPHHHRHRLSPGSSRACRAGDYLTRWLCWQMTTTNNIRTTKFPGLFAITANSYGRIINERLSVGLRVGGVMMRTLLLHKMICCGDKSSTMTKLFGKKSVGNYRCLKFFKLPVNKQSKIVKELSTEFNSVKLHFCCN